MLDQVTVYTTSMCKNHIHPNLYTQAPKENLLTLYTRVKVMSLGVYPVARSGVLCAGTPPLEELLHAVKQTVVSVWPFQLGTFSPLQNRAKKQDVNL